MGKLCCNGGYQEVLSSGTINVRAGDILRIKGVVEFDVDSNTNLSGCSSANIDQAVRGHLRLKANGNQIGFAQHQNNWGSGYTPGAPNHMPLWVDAVYEAQSAGNVNISAEFSATRQSPVCADVTIYAGGTSHISVELYHNYTSQFEVNSELPYFLNSFIGTLDIITGENDYNFGLINSSASHNSNRAWPYRINTLSVNSGDLVQLWSQVTGKHKGGTSPAEMLGHSVVRYDVSPTAYIGGFVETENNPYQIQYLPSFVDTYEYISGSGYPDYRTMAHGIRGDSYRGAYLASDSGHLFAQRFTKDPGGMPIMSGYSLENITTSNSSLSNISIGSSYTQINSQNITMNNSDILRIVSNVQLDRSTIGSSSSILCTMYTTILGPTSQVLESSSVSLQYFIQKLEVMPLRNQHIFKTSLPNNSLHTVKTDLRCQGSISGSINLVASDTQMIVDHFKSF